jgi:beta-glucosidase
LLHFSKQGPRSTAACVIQHKTEGKNKTAMKNSLKFALACLALTLIASAYLLAQDAKVTGNARVDRLLAQMTLDEKIAMIHGAGEDASTYQGQAGYLPGIKRLGIPAMRLADGPPGVLTRIPSIALTSTMGVASTFSREDARLSGSVIGREARDRGISIALQPFINIDRDFAFSRGYNTFGEDPFLTGEMGAAEVHGIQDEGVMAQAKHFIGYDTDGDDVLIGEQALHEVYAAPFAAAVRAGVASIMCSYNRINGAYACGNSATLQKLLRQEIGFKGFITSDWGAIHATDYINKGVDMEMPGPLDVTFAGDSFFVQGFKRPAPKGGVDEGFALTDGGMLPEEPKPTAFPGSSDAKPTDNLKGLLAKGVITEAVITEAAGRVLVQMDRFGYLDGKIKLDVTPSSESENAKIVEKTAIDSAVLLKNISGALPLKATDLEDLVLIGPGANQPVAVGLTKEKALGLPALQTGPLAAIRQMAGSFAHVSYAVANDMEGNPVPAQYLSHYGVPGLERRMWNENAVHSDAEINFTSKAGTALPANATIVWQGTLQAPESGKYRIQLQLLGCWGKLKIDDQVVSKTWFNYIHGEIVQPGQDSLLPTTDGLDNLRAEMNLTAGLHRIEIAVDPDTSNAPVQVKFTWVMPSEQQENYRKAVEAARHAHTAVVFAWSRTFPVFALPGDQDKLISDIAVVNPNTIVVLNVNQPVAMPWLDKVKAVLDMGWTGDLGGPATAKVLLGLANTGGRLPFTWPARIEDMPAQDPHYPDRTMRGVRQKTTFSEGVLVGYRWLDKKGIKPLFPFGYGLSYTSFDCSGAQADRSPDGGVDVRIIVHNSGTMAGDEVAQVYLDKPSDAPAGVEFANSILAGFERVSLPVGESKMVVIHVPLRQFQYWSTEKHAWVTPLGSRNLWVGSSSRDHRLEAQIEFNPASGDAENPPYLNPALGAEERANDLVARMTMEEKASQVVHISAAIPRLKVPAYNWWTEALHGVATNIATVFPEPIGMGATFDVNLLHDVATAIGTEARAIHTDQIGRGNHMGVGLDFWAPNVNIFRDPRWGRGQETYGEDPYLTGQMGTTYVKAMQGDDPRYLKVIATPKHFAVHSGPEPVRHTMDVEVSKHDEEDTYLPAFRQTVIEGKAASVMCAYNRINGDPACASPFLLEDQLRGKWRFTGYVVSDCDAVFDIARGHHYTATQEEAAALSMVRGTDLDCNDPGDDYTPYVNAVKKGLLPESVLDLAVKRLVMARIQLGEFDPPKMVPYAQISIAENDSEAHRALAEKAAEKSMVLLKNNGILPLASSVTKMEVVGPLADQAKVLWGNYNGTPSRSTTALDGIRRAFPAARVVYAQGTDFLVEDHMPLPASALQTEDGQQGLKAEYFQGTELAGPPLLTRIDKMVDFDNWIPSDALGSQNFSARWKGYIVPEKSGHYELGFIGDDGFRMELDGKPWVESWMNENATTKTGAVDLQAGHKYAVKIEYFQGGGGSAAHLVWSGARAAAPKLLEEALKEAKDADVIVAVVGITSSLEGEEMKVTVPGFEGGDRTSIDLPAPEEELLKAMKSTGKPLVVVLMNGSALAVKWAEANADAIVDSWYAGEEGGTAIGATLAGKNNPAGRLPVTFYADTSQLPRFDDYSTRERTYRYFHGKPLYPFGYGLSYSKFAYDGLKLSKQVIGPEESLTVSAVVKNTSRVDGDEVVQLYLGYPDLAGAPIRALRGFTRVHLAAGESREIQFKVEPRELSMVNAAGDRMVQEGKYTVSVGGGQPGTSAAVVQGEFNLHGSMRLPE